MLKFVVVVFKLPAPTEEEFVRYFRKIHGPPAQKLPGLKKYTQNFVARDPAQKHPSWNVVIELYWDNWQMMEEAWKSPEGVAATADLCAFADLTRATWSVDVGRDWQSMPNSSKLTG
jgi:uncharacterized protein (TIGR02118 family)